MKKISDAVEKQKNEIIALTKQLINIPTVNPPGLNYRCFVDFLEKQCKWVGLTTNRYIVRGHELKALGINKGSSRINLVGRWRTKSKKTLHINAHYDVVPASKNWNVDPFCASVKQGKLFGRGSEDMKANIACIIFAIYVLKKLNIKPSVNIEVSFTPDEETGGASGLAYLLKKKIVKADYAIGEGYADDYVAVGNKGMLWVEFEILGKSSHASTPYQGRNSFGDMLKVTAELNKLHKSLARRKTKYGTKDARNAFSTMVIGGLVRGGEKINMVPDSTIFSIDRRLIPEETIACAKKEIKQIVAKLRRKDRKLRLRMKTLIEEEAVVSKKNDKLMGAFSEAVRLVLNKRLKTAIMPGGTDLRFFAQRGVPCLGYSVKGAQRAHADNEFVYCNSIVETVKIFAYVISHLN